MYMYNRLYIAHFISVHRYITGFSLPEQPAEVDTPAPAPIPPSPVPTQPAVLQPQSEPNTATPATSDPAVVRRRVGAGECTTTGE